jgi:oligopeptidase A
MNWSTTTILLPDGTRALLTRLDWNSIATEDVLPMLRALVAEGRQLADRIAEMTEPDLVSFVLAQEELDDRIHKLWGPIAHLNAVAQTEELRAVVKEGTLILSDYASDMTHHEGLFRAYEYVATSDAFRAFSEEERTIITHTLRDFRREGVALSIEKKEELKKLNAELSALEEEFSDHVLDAEGEWTHMLPDRSSLSGVPEDVVEGMRRDALERGCEGYLVTLKQPVVVAILTHATDRGLRERVFVANNTRASELGRRVELDNTPLIEQILMLREKKARMLGFKNFAEFSVDDKSAPSLLAVTEFLDRLVAKSLPAARREFADLSAFARERLSIDELLPWDIAFVSERLRMERFDISEEALRPYFPASRVFSGLFILMGRLYGLRIEEDRTASVWHDGVKFFLVYDRSGALRGGFYADLYSREKKRGGAWMDDCVARRVIPEMGTQLPIAYLNCNFAAPKDGEEGYLVHSEIETLFHEAGHMFHHVLGLSRYLGSSMSHVEWDAIECPSQLLEYWCWEKDVLQGLSAHPETGAPLPAEICERLKRAKNFGSGMASVRQLEFAITDIELHAKETTDPRTPRDVLSAVRSRVRVAPVYANDRFLNSFQHIFSGGYAAGYYSYKWAEVLAADLYEAFLEEGGSCDPRTGTRLLHEVLELGASRAFLESFKRFRGRAPSEDALLRETGLL